MTEQKGKSRLGAAPQATRGSLRQEAAEKLANPSPASAPGNSTPELLHELQVQQIELEMQNEELRSAHTAIEKSRDRYADLYDFAPVGYITLSAHGTINEINLTAAALLGMERGKLIQRRFAPFVVPENTDLWHQHFMRTKHKREKLSFELALKPDVGPVLHAQLDCLPADDLVHIVLIDITERKRMEKEILERRNEMAELHTLHVAAQTAAAIAHELNQPLLAIASYSKAALMLMKAETPDFGKIAKAIEGCERQSHRAGQSIRDLLQLLSTEEFPTEEFDLNQEITDVLETARLEHELQFDSLLRLENDLPPILANRAHVQKVLFNLLRNGIEAMQDAGVPLPAITVTVCTKANAGVALVTIQDNGPGIMQEHAHRLFEPFFTTKAKGIGMGLAISRMLIEENGGQLWMDEQQGCGATFHLTLPFAS
ncbi:MAG: ATP-binding protein [Sideroxyarcus sp.]|nr:ATP-binding protein [Sideroxyarcus sp.]